MRYYFHAFISGVILLCVMLSVSMDTAVGIAATATPMTYVPAAGSVVMVKGKSTLHAWSAKSTVINGRVIFSGHWHETSPDFMTIKLIHLTIPVGTLKGSDGSGMTNAMMEALHRREHPDITFILTKAHLSRRPSAKNKTYLCNTSGLLKINGIMHAVKLALIVLPHPGGKMTIQTDTKIKMRDYRVTPPTAMFGLLRAANSITVRVTWQLVATRPGNRH